MIDFDRMDWLIRQIPKTEKKKREAWSKATRCTAKWSAEPSGGGMPGDPVGNGATELAVIEDMKAEYMALRDALRPYIDSINRHPVRLVMEKRYIGHRPIGWIARATGYSREHVYRLIRDGKTEIQEELFNTLSAVEAVDEVKRRFGIDIKDEMEEE